MYKTKYFINKISINTLNNVLKFKYYKNTFSIYISDVICNLI